MNKKKVIIIILICLIVIASAITFSLAIKNAKSSLTLKSTETLGRQETEYSLSENGLHISSIPFDEYEKKVSLPKKHVTVEGLLPNNNYYSNTELIQKAINELSKDENGGGTVYIPEGEYYITSIELKDNITLYIDPECTLYSITNLEYSSMNEKHSSVIYAKKAKNITVTGGGTINGWGDTFAGDAEVSEPFYALKSFNLYTSVIESEKRRLYPESDASRPDLISFTNCENISVSSLKICSSAAKSIAFSICKNIKAENIVIDNNLYIEGVEGIILDGCTNADVKNCFIATAESGVSIKSTKRKSLNVTVSNCEISAFNCCFRIGDETNYNIQKITVSDCSFFVPDRICALNTGLSIESADGSKVSEVIISDIEMNGVSSPLLIWLGDRLDLEKKEVGSIHDIDIKNIKSTNIELPCVITGCKAKSVYNISLTDFDLSYRESDEDLDLKGDSLTKALSSYPDIANVSAKIGKTKENSIFYSVPAYGLFLRYTEDSINVDNFNCVPRKCNQLEMIVNQENILGSD